MGGVQAYLELDRGRRPGLIYPFSFPVAPLRLCARCAFTSFLPLSLPISSLQLNIQATSVLVLDRILVTRSPALCLSHRPTSQPTHQPRLLSPHLFPVTTRSTRKVNKNAVVHHPLYHRPRRSGVGSESGWNTLLYVCCLSSIASFFPFPCD